MNNASPRIDTTELTPGLSAGGELETAIGQFAAAALSADGVDPIVTELVRLRCAQIHDCRICGSLRIQEALDEGFDETMQRKIADYEHSDFSPKIIAALRLCDAIILDPLSADETLKQQLKRHFSEPQITEICFDIIKWSQQKPLVALRLDKPDWDQPTALTFDENGTPIFGGPAYI